MGTMHAFVEYPCACRGTVVVRIGPEATEAPKPYVFSVTCRIAGGEALAIGVNAPAEGILPEYVTACTRALRREGLRLRWRRENHEKTRDILSTRC